jgi:hypothetical protein
MPELGPYGSVRGARGNSRPYRESDRPTAKTALLTLLGRLGTLPRMTASRLMAVVRMLLVPPWKRTLDLAVALRRLSPLVGPDDRDAIFGIEQTH